MTKYEWEKELKKNIYKLPPEEIDKIADYYNELFLDKAESGMSEKSIINEFGNPFDVARKIMNEYETENGTASMSGKTGTKNEFKDSFNSGDFYDDRPEHIKRFSGKIARSMERGSDEFFHGKSEQNAEYEETEDDRPEFIKKFAGKMHKAMLDLKDGIFYGGKQEKKETQYEAAKNHQTAAYYDEPVSHTAKAVEKQKSGGFWSGFFKVLFFIPFFIISIALWAVGVSLVVAGVACVIAGAAQAVIAFINVPAGGMIAMAKIGIGFAAAGIGILLFFFSIRFIKMMARLTARYFGAKKAAKRGEII